MVVDAFVEKIRSVSFRPTCGLFGIRAGFSQRFTELLREFLSPNFNQR